MEGELADGLTLVERNEDGRYSSRLSNAKRVPGEVYVPPHLYGQLARHSLGLSTLLADDNIPRLIQVSFTFFISNGFLYYLKEIQLDTKILSGTV